MSAFDAVHVDARDAAFMTLYAGLGILGTATGHGIAGFALAAAVGGSRAFLTGGGVLTNRRDGVHTDARVCDTPDDDPRGGAR
jgi:hypothetical protein